MKISSQEEYGLRCLLRFARVKPGESLTIPEVAAAEQLSVPYVAKLLAVLRKAGVIESARGRSGGYRLTAPPSAIGLGSVMRTLGEPLFDEGGFCDRHAGLDANGCVHQDDCSLRGLWRAIETWMRLTLDQITLADLLALKEANVPELVQARLTTEATRPIRSLLRS